MSNNEKLRDAVVEKARETSQVVRAIGMRILPPAFNAALERQDAAVRALDAAERPRFSWQRMATGYAPVFDHGDTFRILDLKTAELAARLLNEHFAKERP